MYKLIFLLSFIFTQAIISSSFAISSADSTDKNNTYDDKYDKQTQIKELDDAKWENNVGDRRVSMPDPDMANYSNSAFTLPQGEFYIETRLLYESDGSPTSEQFRLPYLIRYGLFDWMEVRVGSFGPVLKYHKNSHGVNPLTFDTKFHLIDENEVNILPAIALELSYTTTWLGTVSQTNTTPGPGFSLNFDKTLPYDFTFETDIGAGYLVDYENKSGTASRQYWRAIFHWSLQHDLLDNLAVFIHGYNYFQDNAVMHGNSAYIVYKNNDYGSAGGGVNLGG
ncbi:hypothetical protein RP726_13155 [Candidatus Methylospira mobilis]|uniref:hypothetical protein n=1 Tax=Candidatus Methylospira mobilis TaxID=1808979 RepID=UPI0028E19AB3|nr:hypothetical protein [Candidatus Methylospira mobilis]WNV03400.1 hypothetical protein RP726_13155 [Candidatus Methylospira mobilis]